MQTPPRRFPQGWSARDILQPDIFKLTPLDEVFELRYDSEIQTISNLCITLYVVKSLTFKKLWDIVLFKFQWHIEKHLRELSLRQIFNSMSLLSLINLMRNNRLYYKYTKNIWNIMSNYEKNIIKKNTCLKKRINWNTK